LLDALSLRAAAPRLHRSGRDWWLELDGEPPARFSPADHDPIERARLAAADGMERVAVALSLPLGIQALPEEDAQPLLAAFHDGILELGEPFLLWATPLDPAGAHALLDRGAVGACLPAASLASEAGLRRAAPVLSALEQRDAALFLHPGPAPPAAGAVPAWWPAMTSYVAEMHAAWHAWAAWGRPAHPRLRVTFAMLAGCAPLHAERLATRGGPVAAVHDELTYFDISSYGPRTVDAMVRIVGVDRLVHGSDRPVAAPPDLSSLGTSFAHALVEVNPSRLLSPDPVTV
jgi:hypothetical protein